MFGTEELEELLNGELGEAGQNAAGAPQPGAAADGAQGEQPGAEGTPQPDAGAAQTEPAGQSTPAGQNTTSGQSEKIKIKFNHEERELTFAEAAELAQKGLLADKLREKTERYEQLARRAGFESVAAMEAAIEEQERTARNAEFRAKNGFERDALEPVIRETIENNPDVKAAREIVRRNQLDEAVRSLKSTVPECTYQSAQDLFADPKFGEINQLVQAGLPLDRAYGAVYAAELAQQRIAKSTPPPAPAPSTGSVKSTVMPTKATYISPEEVDKMTPAEVKQNLELIEKSMPKWPVK